MPLLTAAAPGLPPAGDLAVVVGVHQQEAELALWSALPPGTTEDDLLTLLTTLGATAAEGEVTKVAGLGGLNRMTLAVGLGRLPRGAEDFTLDTYRRAAGTAARALVGQSAALVSLPSPQLLASPEHLAAVCDGLLLGGYTFTRYATEKASIRTEPVGTWHVVWGGPEDAGAKTLDSCSRMFDVVALCRDMVNTPAADMTPADVARIAEQEGAALDVSVLGLTELREHGYGGIVGVGQGSQNAPCLVRVDYNPAGAQCHVALVGKGITFDSGGLSIKGNESMVAMKSDMAGAAAALCAVLGAQRLGLGVRVTAWLPLAENMPDGGAIRPSDVLRLYGGKTVEVNNTDAEGRLVLADAIGRAAEEHPDILIDIATLTGAHISAVGLHYTAVMSNDDYLRADLLAAAEATGEDAWPVPLPPALRSAVDSEIADLRNSGGIKGAVAIGGLFLREFVPEGLRWAHLDIAGADTQRDAPFGYRPLGATGAPVRTLLALLQGLDAPRA